MSTYFFSAPGRTEISGNHTDHQHGCVLAAAVNLETVAEVIKETPVVTETKPQESVYTGYVTLEGLSEQDAAAVMAITSHKTGIPLENLYFKSIKLLED